MNARDFLQTPSQHIHRELIAGKTSITHKNEPFAEKIYAVLSTLPVPGTFVRSAYVLLDDTNVVRPTAFWISPDFRCQPENKDTYIGVPDLIIEVLAFGAGRLVRKEKFHLYQSLGVKEYWIVERWARRVTVNVLNNGLYNPQGTYYQRMVHNFTSLVLETDITLNRLFF
ncbi:MAG: Uma2 family endonuclease [Chloroflexi bacterium]|nr:Uma2 family endonuclease [Chloroflexota bacterium]